MNIIDMDCKTNSRAYWAKYHARSKALPWIISEVNGKTYKCRTYTVEGRTMNDVIPVKLVTHRNITRSRYVPITGTISLIDRRQIKHVTRVKPEQTNSPNFKNKVTLLSQNCNARAKVLDTLNKKIRAMQGYNMEAFRTNKKLREEIKDLKYGNRVFTRINKTLREQALANKAEVDSLRLEIVDLKYVNSVVKHANNQLREQAFTFQVESLLMLKVENFQLRTALRKFEQNSEFEHIENCMRTFDSFCKASLPSPVYILSPKTVMKADDFYLAKANNTIYFMFNIACRIFRSWVTGY